MITAQEARKLTLKALVLMERFEEAEVLRKRMEEAGENTDIE